MRHLRTLLRSRHSTEQHGGRSRRGPDSQTAQTRSPLFLEVRPNPLTIDNLGPPPLPSLFQVPSLTQLPPLTADSATTIAPEKRSANVSPSPSVTPPSKPSSATTQPPSAAWLNSSSTSATTWPTHSKTPPLPSWVCKNLQFYHTSGPCHRLSI